MTQREFFENVMTETMNEEVKAFAAEGIAKLDAQVAKRRELAAAKAEEDQKMIDNIVNTILNSEFKSASEIGLQLNITTPKATVLLKKAVEQGKAVTDKIKLPKRGEVKGYKLA